MPILGVFMVPHPPIILPEVGKGEEEKIRKTSEAYMKVAEEIAYLKPDTIIVSSPHSIMYADYFHISPEICRGLVPGALASGRSTTPDWSIKSVRSP